MVTSVPIETSRAGEVADRANPAGRTGTHSTDVVAAPAVQTHTLPLAVQAIEALWTGFLTEGPGPAQLTGTGSAHMVT